MFMHKPIILINNSFLPYLITSWWLIKTIWFVEVNSCRQNIIYIYQYLIQSNKFTLKKLAPLQKIPASDFFAAGIFY